MMSVSVAGPEKIIMEFEAGMCLRKGLIPKHYNLSPSVQKRFAADTKAPVAAFQELGNPFDEDGNHHP